MGFSLLSLTQYLNTREVSQTSRVFKLVRIDDIYDHKANR